MKIKNIAAGDFVQVKKSLCHSEFKAKQVCEVIDTDHTDKYGFDVLIQGKNCLDWVNHKHLKKPEPQLKLLEVDLSSELTGSDLCRAMLARGDKYVMCMTSSGVDIIDDLDCPLSSTCPFIGYLDNYRHAVPINNQGEPLTASEAGL